MYNLIITTGFSITWIMVGLTLFSNSAHGVNVNKTDGEQILAECLEVASDGEYYNNPDMNIRAIEIIQKYGYPAEVHHAITEDGYILELHRIPYSKKFPEGGQKPVVFIQHGIMASSVNWILPPVEKALGFRMADMGYDVWLGNARGSSYSLGHVNPLKHHKNVKYWDFSWHEMGKYDLPAAIDYVLETTNHTKLTYIGHSMGCTMFFVCMSLRPEYNEKIDLMIGLAPVAFVGSATSFFKLFAPYSYNLERIYQYVGGGQLIPEQLRKFLNPFMANSCSSPMLNCHICTKLYFLLFNSDGNQLNHTMLPVITSHFPDRVSTKTVTHFGQNLVANTFQEFDDRFVLPNWYSPGFSARGKRPAKYDLKKVTAPVVVFYADRDNLADPKDVGRLLKVLPNLKGAVRVCYHLFNHNDFLFGVDVNELVYDKLISIVHGNFDVDVNCQRKYILNHQQTKNESYNEP